MIFFVAAGTFLIGTLAGLLAGMGFLLKSVKRDLVGEQSRSRETIDLLAETTKQVIGPIQEAVVNSVRETVKAITFPLGTEPNEPVVVSAEEDLFNEIQEDGFDVSPGWLQDAEDEAQAFAPEGA